MLWAKGFRRQGQEEYDGRFLQVLCVYLPTCEWANGWAKKHDEKAGLYTYI